MIIDCWKYSKKITSASNVILIIICFISFTFYGCEDVKNPQTENEFDDGKVWKTSEVDSFPQIISPFDPIYPMSARAKGIEGSVILRFVVDRHGYAREAEVTRAEPVGVFEDAALEALTKYNFKPAIKDDKPVDCFAKLTIKFSLKEPGHIKKPISPPNMSDKEPLEPPIKSDQLVYKYFYKWGISFEYPYEWQEYRDDPRVARVKKVLEQYPQINGWDLKEFTIIGAPRDADGKELLNIVVSKYMMTKAMKPSEIVDELKQHFDNIKPDGYEVKVNHIKESTIDRLPAVEEDFELSYGGGFRNQEFMILAGTTVFQVSFRGFNRQFSQYSNVIDHIVSSIEVGGVR